MLLLANTKNFYKPKCYKKAINFKLLDQTN